MEEAEVPMEHLHEQIHERAEHGTAQWISWVALSTAILAVLAAIAGLLSGGHANEAMMSQIDASDQGDFTRRRASRPRSWNRRVRLPQPPRPQRSRRLRSI